MKTNAWMMLGLAAVMGTGSVANAAQWGFKELKDSENYIVGSYLQTVGAQTTDEIAAAKDAIDAYSVKKGLQGDSASVSLTYKRDGVKKTISAFCHEHEPGEIDCH